MQNRVKPRANLGLRRVKVWAGSSKDTVSFEGWFHRFCETGEVEKRDGDYCTAIIEKDDGTLTSEPFYLVQFIEEAEPVEACPDCEIYDGIAVKRNRYGLGNPEGYSGIGKCSLCAFKNDTKRCNMASCFYVDKNNDRHLDGNDVRHYYFSLTERGSVNA